MATRPTYTSVFEESESNIQARILSHESLADWRKEPGDFVYDVEAPHALEIQQLEINQDTILKNAFAQTAEGEYLDLKLQEVGLERNLATPTKRQLLITADAAVTLPAGHGLTTLVLDADGNPIEWTVDTTITWNTSGVKTVAITSVQTGATTNVPSGSEFVLQPPIPGVRLVADNGTIQAGTDTESDNAAWERYDFKVKNPDTGGNKNDYVRWSKDVPGVGKARCVPRWNGNGTVKVILLGTDLLPASTAVVADVQEYLDPGKTGLGDGKAPCGAVVTAVAATSLPITVSATVTYSAGYDPTAVKVEFSANLDTYLRSIVFADDENGNPLPVNYNKVAAYLSITNGVANYSNLKVNNGVIDIAVSAEQAPTRGTVTM